MNSEDLLNFSSSIAGDVWQMPAAPPSHQAWYFDAINDDGRDALTITFFDNFIFSPRYNSRYRAANGPQQRSRFPALVFFYYRDGKPLYASACEFGEGVFTSDGDIPSCKIGENSFQFESAPYGEGYLLNIDVEMKNGRRLKANLEWLIVEGNLRPADNSRQGLFSWNLVSPRCDVTGRIEVYRSNGTLRETIQFRGTGYHDHRKDDRWLPATMGCWQWGRAHFADLTAAFCIYQPVGSTETTTKFFLTTSHKIEEKTAYYEEKNFSRNVLGLKYPRRLTFYVKGDLRLRLKQTRTMESNFFYVRCLSEAVLTIGDGKPRKTAAITEFFRPPALRKRWLDWMIDMRINRVS
jgi:carotenoid 1,2-hydratase